MTEYRGTNAQLCNALLHISNRQTTSRTDRIVCQEAADRIAAIKTGNDVNVTMQKLTKEQAAIIGAFTGVLCGPFADFHNYAEKILGRPILNIEFGTNDLAVALKESARKDFLAIVAT